MTGEAWQPVPGSEGNLIEAPRWIPGLEVFQWVDILDSAIFRWSPYSDAPAERRPVDLEFCTVAIPLDDDRSLVAGRSSLHEYRWSEGSLSLLGSWDFGPDIRFNDGDLSPAGDVYIGTMCMARRDGEAHLYKYDGELVPVIADRGISNGIAWAAPDLTYYIDSLKTAVFSVDLTRPSPRLETFHALAADDEPDGLTVTPEGTVLVAMWEGGRLIEIDSSGHPVRVIDVPAVSPTSVRIGGRDDELMLVTTAATGGTPGRALVRQR